MKLKPGMLLRFCKQKVLFSYGSTRSSTHFKVGDIVMLVDTEQDKEGDERYILLHEGRLAWIWRIDRGGQRVIDIFEEAIE